MSFISDISQLGWQSFFQQQMSLEEWETLTPARVIEQHKSEVILAGEFDTIHLLLLHSMPPLVVGDWLLLDSDRQFVRLLERKTCFRRRRAGKTSDTQMISANVDSAFIVCSMNQDFNLNRIERYLALVAESEAEPVVVLSKSDLASNPASFVEQVEKLDPLLAVVAINALDCDSVGQLQPWLKTGRTVAVLGSSGVGKSTLVNTLLGEQAQSTGGIREDDDKGRHTTTRRSLLVLEAGGLLLDTPGMREVQLADCEEGIVAAFADIEALAGQCRFSNCHHDNEPGCAVQRAVAEGVVEERRLLNYLKLRREDAFNSASLHEKRAKDKALGRYYRRTLADSNKLRGK